MNKGGFSWKRFTGVTAAKQKIARKTGIPTTKSGRQRKLGKAMGGCLLPILMIIFGIIFCVMTFGAEVDSSELVTKSEIAYFKDTPYTGTSFTKYKSGQFKIKETWTNGKQNGECIWFFRSGKIQSKGNYKNGAKDGEFIEYDEEGKILKKEKFIDGFDKNGYNNLGLDKNGFDKEIHDSINKHEVLNGMTKKAVELSLGKPHSIEESTKFDKYGTRTNFTSEKWEYQSCQVYFRDGKVYHKTISLKNEVENKTENSNIHIGPKGGKYYINKNGKKTYVK